MKNEGSTVNPEVSSAELFTLWIIMVSVAGVALLMLNWFGSLKAIVIGSALTSLIVIRLSAEISWLPKGLDPFLVLILLAALLFRSEPYLWIMGGQDQGTYVNMSAQYERTGSPFIKDRMREQVDAVDLPYYDQTQILYKRITEDAKDLKGKYPIKFSPEKNRFYFAMTQPAVYLKNLSRSEYVFQFYPLHPIWMAIFAKMFGSDNRVYAVVFFSLLSIFAFFKLALELSGGNRYAGYLTAAFLALNPLHAYFAKFPVSETPGLFFSACGFLFLAKYYRKLKDGVSLAKYALLSLGAFFCLFLTHISGFLYAIFFSAAVIYMLVSDCDAYMKASLFKCYILFTALFLFSVGYGYFYSYPYFYEIFSALLRPVLGHYWASIMVGALLFYLVVLVVLSRKLMNNNISIKLLTYRLDFLLLFMFGLIVFTACFRIYQIGCTEKYLGHIYYDKEFKLVGNFLLTLETSNLFVYIKYLSPPAFLFLPMSVVVQKVRRKTLVDVENSTCKKLAATNSSPNTLSLHPYRNSYISLLLAFIVFISAFRLVANNVAPYQYYYARYLLAELVPYSLLLVSISLGGMLVSEERQKKVLVALIVLSMVVYFGYITWYQFKGREAEGAAASLRRVAGRLDDSKLLVYKFEDGKAYSPADSFIIMPLMYYYGANMLFTNSLDELKSNMFVKLRSRYSETYVLTRQPLASGTSELLDVIDGRHGMFAHTNRIPSDFLYTRFSLYLYRVPAL